MLYDAFNVASFENKSNFKLYTLTQVATYRMPATKVAANAAKSAFAD
jgi:hypothetical protein